LGRKGTILPYLFEDPDGGTVTVNTEQYNEQTKRKLSPELSTESEARSGRA